jgi:mercuric ion binding protein
MKNIIYIVAFTGILFACSFDSKEVTEVIKTEVLANTETKFGLEGMTCAHGCAARIEEKLNKMDGVASAKVDFETKEAWVSFDNNITNNVNFKEMIEALNDNQYKVVKEPSNTSVNEEYSESISETTEIGNVLNLDFELPNILDFFTNII